MRISKVTKGQIISKRFFLAKDSPKKRTKIRRMYTSKNEFICLDNLLSKVADLYTAYNLFEGKENL